jgi:hypothetical protein
MSYLLGCKDSEGNEYNCKNCAYNADKSGCKTNREDRKAVTISSKEYPTIDERFDEHEDIVDDRFREQRRW